MRWWQRWWWFSHLSLADPTTFDLCLLYLGGLLVGCTRTPQATKPFSVLRRVISQACFSVFPNQKRRYRSLHLPSLRCVEHITMNLLSSLHPPFTTAHTDIHHFMLWRLLHQQQGKPWWKVPQPPYGVLVVQSLRRNHLRCQLLRGRWFLSLCYLGITTRLAWRYPRVAYPNTYLNFFSFWCNAAFRMAPAPVSSGISTHDLPHDSFEQVYRIVKVYNIFWCQTASSHYYYTQIRRTCEHYEAKCSGKYQNHVAASRYRR